MLNLIINVVTGELVFQSKNEQITQRYGLEKLASLRRLKSPDAENIAYLSIYQTTSSLENELITNESSRKTWWETSQKTDRDRNVVGYRLADLNPNNMDASLIPYGDYCYSGVESIRTDERGMPVRTMKMCPYSSYRIFNGVTVPWCNFLNKGGTEGSLKQGQTEEQAEEEYQKLVAHFGTEEALDKALPLFLLFDDCKECGINCSQEEDFFVM